MRVAAFVVICGWFVTLPALGQMACDGKERWSIKTLADSGAANLDKSPIDKTVAEMTELTRPEKVDDALPRTPPTEATTYRIKANLTLYKEEADQDYHLVLNDMNDDEVTMIVEIPDPKCVSKDSPGLAQITQARQDFSNKFRVSKDMHATKIPVTVVGVGFFDIVHGGEGQTGHAKNNIELHPVLSITFDGPEPPDFAVPTAAANAPAPKTTILGIELSQLNILLMWWVIALGMTIFLIYAIHETVQTLKNSKDWSLSEALKEETSGKPSSSRLIAFLGLLILMVLYMEIGYVVIWRLLNNEGVPDVHAFLLTGLSLFAPYAFNQLKQFGAGLAAGGSNANATKVAPKVLSVNPKSVNAETSTQVTITGLGFDSKAKISVTTGSGSLDIPSPTVTATTIQFLVTMPKGVAPYTAVIRISNPDGSQATTTFQVS